MRKVWQATVLTVSLSVAAAAAQKPAKAESLLNEAKTKAADQKKTIFLTFDASWCEACHQIDVFLAIPEVAAIFEKYFVIVKLTYGEGAAGHPEWDNPGADTMIARYGGVSSSGRASLPFIALLDPKARLIINSSRPTKSNTEGKEVGFPTEPEEINWFIGMLKKGAPALTEEEAQTVRNGLQKAAAD